MSIQKNKKEKRKESRPQTALCQRLQRTFKDVRCFIDPRFIFNILVCYSNNNNNYDNDNNSICTGTTTAVRRSRTFIREI